MIYNFKWKCKTCDKTFVHHSAFRNHSIKLDHDVMADIVEKESEKR